MTLRLLFFRTLPLILISCLGSSRTEAAGPCEQPSITKASVVESCLDAIRKPLYAKPTYEQILEASRRMLKLAPRVELLRRKESELSTVERKVANGFREFHLDLLEIRKVEERLSTCTGEGDALKSRRMQTTETLANQVEHLRGNVAVCSLKERRAASGELDHRAVSRVDNELGTLGNMLRMNEKVTDLSMRSMSPEKFRAMLARENAPRGDLQSYVPESVIRHPDALKAKAKDLDQKVAAYQAAHPDELPTRGAAERYIEKKYGFRFTDESQRTKTTQDFHLAIIAESRKSNFTNYVYYTQRFAFSGEPDLTRSSNPNSALMKTAQSLYDFRNVKGATTLDSAVEYEMAALGRQELARYRKEFPGKTRLTEEDVLEQLSEPLQLFREEARLMRQGADVKLAMHDDQATAKQEKRFRNVRQAQQAADQALAKLKHSETGFLLHSRAFNEARSSGELDRFTAAQLKALMRSALQEHIGSTREYGRRFIAPNQYPQDYWGRKREASEYTRPGAVLLYSSPSAIQKLIARNPQYTGVYCEYMKSAAKLRNVKTPQWIVWGGGLMQVAGGPLNPGASVAFGVVSTIAVTAPLRAANRELRKQESHASAGEKVHERDLDLILSDRMELKRSILENENRIEAAWMEMAAGEAAGFGAGKIVSRAMRPASKLHEAVPTGPGASVRRSEVLASSSGSGITEGAIEFEVTALSKNPSRNWFGPGPETKPLSKTEVDAFFSAEPKSQVALMRKLGVPVESRSSAGGGGHELIVRSDSTEKSANHLMRELKKVSARMSGKPGAEKSPLQVIFSMENHPQHVRGRYVEASNTIIVGREELEIYLRTGRTSDLLPHEVRHYMLTQKADPRFQILAHSAPGSSEAIPVAGYRDFLSAQEKITIQKGVYSKARRDLNAMDGIVDEAGASLDADAIRRLRVHQEALNVSKQDMKTVRQIDATMKAADNSARNFKDLSKAVEAAANTGEDGMLPLLVKHEGQEYIVRVSCTSCAELDRFKVWDRLTRMIQKPGSPASGSDAPPPGLIEDLWNVVIQGTRPSGTSTLSTHPNASKLISEAGRIREEYLTSIRKEIRSHFQELLSNSAEVKASVDKVHSLDRDLHVTLAKTAGPVPTAEVRTILRDYRKVMGDFSSAPDRRINPRRPSLEIDSDKSGAGAVFRDSPEKSTSRPGSTPSSTAAKAASQNPGHAKTAASLAGESGYPQSLPSYIMRDEDRVRIDGWFNDASLPKGEAERRAFELVLNQRLSLLPREVAESVREDIHARLFIQSGRNRSGAYTAGLRQIDLEIPDRYRSSIDEYSLLTHEIEHSVQDKLYRNFSLRAQEEGEYLFQSEKGAMTAEWQYLHSIPEKTRLALIQEMEQDRSFATRGALRQLKNAGLPVDQYLQKEWDAYRYSRETTEQYVTLNAQAREQPKPLETAKKAPRMFPKGSWFVGGASAAYAARCIYMKSRKSEKEQRSSVFYRTFCTQPGR